MAEQNDGAAAAGGCQACGEIFVDFHGGAKNAAKNVPCVDIKFKVRRLSDFDSKTGTFFCDTLLMLDWEDPSLARATNGKPDFSQHFWPKAEMLGVTPSGGEEPPWDTTKPKYKPVKEKGSNVVKEHRATITVNYRMVLFARCIGKGVRPVAKHPERWRGPKNPKEGGHVLLKDCDCLPEYDFARMASRAYSSAYGPYVSKDQKDEFIKDRDGGKLYQDQYTLQVVMVRDSVSVMWNMCFSLFVIDVMVFAAHGIAMGELADRMGVNLTLLLTSMAFKWVLSDKLPPVPYLTTMEKYVIMTFFCLWLQGITFWFLSDWYNYRCKMDEAGNAVKTDYWSGLKLDGNKTIPMDVTCEVLQQIDRSVMFVEVLALLVKNGWFVKRILDNNQDKVRKQKHYINLGGLGEFSMAKDMHHCKPPAFEEQMLKPQYLSGDAVQLGENALYSVDRRGSATGGGTRVAPVGGGE